MALQWNDGWWSTTPAYWQYLHPGSTGIAVREWASTSGTLLYRLSSSDKWDWFQEYDTTTVNGHIWLYHSGNRDWWGWSATWSSGSTYFSKVQDASSTWNEGYWSGSTDIDYYWPNSGSTTASSLWTWSTIYSPGHTTLGAKTNTHSVTSGSGSFTCTVKNRGSTVTSKTGSYTTTSTYTFKGWRSTGSSTPPAITAAATHSANTWYNISAYTWMHAVFSGPSNYTSYSNNQITFSNPGSYTAANGSYTVTLNNNGTTSTLSSAITDTYNFSKWTNSAGSTVTSPYTFTSTTTVTANYTKASTSNASVTLPTPTRTNYIFQGWSTSSTATTGSYAGGSSYKPSGNVTLYAIWKLNSVKLTLVNSAGWTDSTYGPKGGGNYTPGQTGIAISQAIKTGWHFVNWTNSSGTVISTSSSTTITMPTSAATYTANVAKNSYTITYNANGGVGTTASSSHLYDESKALTKNGFTKLGYTFIGWSTSASATSATYTDQQSVKNLSSTHNATITLYAVWKPYTNMYICTSKMSSDGKTLQWRPALKYIYTSNGNSTPTVSSYSITKTAAGASYGFEEDNSWMVSQNDGMTSTAAISVINITANGTDHLYVDGYSDGENNFDYGLLGTLDGAAFTTSNTADTTDVKQSFKGKAGQLITVDYGIPAAGNHTIQAKYIKDGSQNTNTDSFYYKVRFNGSAPTPPVTSSGGSSSGGGTHGGGSN